MGRLTYRNSTCEFCKKINECPVGGRTSVTLAEYEHTGSKMRIGLARRNNYGGKTGTYINAQYQDSETGMNVVVEDVQFCPMCGAKLKELEGVKK